MATHNADDGTGGIDSSIFYECDLIFSFIDAYL